MSAPAVPKAAANDFPGRFREVIADPLNLLIQRDALAGHVADGWVRLHNGLRVQLLGDGAYYGQFSELLVFNRGVHEPLEEFVFQQVLAQLGPTPVMLELGAYWGHYSMWLKSRRPRAEVYLVEPEAANLRAGEANFAANGLDGHFCQAFVGHGEFTVDGWMAGGHGRRLDLLHADIQGHELVMLDGCAEALCRDAVDRVFISTHTQQLHQAVVDRLLLAGWRLEISSDFDNETTAFDGFVYAARSGIPPLFREPLQPLSRQAIAVATPAQLLDYLLRVKHKLLPPAAPGHGH